MHPGPWPLACADWLAEEIPGKVALIRWLPDVIVFYYRRLEDLADPYSASVLLHRLGTDHRQDQVLFRQRNLDFFMMWQLGMFKRP